MGKYHGIVGYAITEENPPGSGKWVDRVIEKHYYGDTVKFTSSKWTNGTSTNDDLEITNNLSIVADPFAYQNFHAIKYAEFMGVMWKVTSVEIQSPRLILTLGGEWNGNRPDEQG